VEKMVAFVSGHLDLTLEEFDEYYKYRIDEAIANKHSFVVGDARGADLLAQSYLFTRTDRVTVFHMYGAPRHNVGFETEGGYISDQARDMAMTSRSTYDIAWVRPGRETSGTAKNIKRRLTWKDDLN
jgi:hypothetical protein